MAKKAKAKGDVSEQLTDPSELNILGHGVGLREKKPLPFIQVVQHPNGYGLAFDGMKQPQGYMYFTVDDLLKGFMVHIGLEITEQLDMETIDDFLEAVINYKSNEKCIKEIERLKQELVSVKVSRNAMARKLMAERARFCALVKSISQLSLEFRGRKEDETRILKAIKNYTKTRPYTEKELGIDGTIIVETEEEDEE